MENDDVTECKYYNINKFKRLKLHFFLVCSLEYYPASPVDKLLSVMYLISSQSEWDMQQCVQFPTVVGFVDIQSCVWEKTMRKQNKNKIK